MGPRDVMVSPVEDSDRNLATGFRLFTRDELLAWQREQATRSSGSK